jgi:hypothetical protein
MFTCSMEPANPSKLDVILVFFNILGSTDARSSKHTDIVNAICILFVFSLLLKPRVSQSVSNLGENFGAACSDSE